MLLVHSVVLECSTLLRFQISIDTWLLFVTIVLLNSRYIMLWRKNEACDRLSIFFLKNHVHEDLISKGWAQVLDVIVLYTDFLMSYYVNERLQFYCCKIVIYANLSQN
jgi:hypothetical protein